MYRTASVAAFDCLDMVWATARVHEFHSIEDDTPTTPVVVSVQVKGVGEEDTDLWLRDVLVALLEAL